MRELKSAAPGVDGSKVQTSGQKGADRLGDVRLHDHPAIFDQARLLAIRDLVGGQKFLPRDPLPEIKKGSIVLDGLPQKAG